MDIEPLFDAVIDRRNGQYKVSIRDGDITAERVFSSEETAEQFRQDAYNSLKTKYAKREL
jgi:hypothetical protein